MREQVVAVSEMRLATGVMPPENAAALVGAGLLSVLLFPLLAGLLRAHEADRQDRAADPEPAAG